MDIWKNPQASLSFTLADQWCKEQDWIAQDPRCPRLLVTGAIARVDQEEEKEFAKDALFTRLVKLGKLFLTIVIPGTQ